MKSVRVVNETRGTLLAEQARVASGPWSRFWGLMGRRQLPPGHALLLQPCTSIHMFFMRFPIDVVFLDHSNTVVKVVHQIKPWRIALGGGGKKALELPAGAAAAGGVQRGDVLSFSDLT